MVCHLISTYRPLLQRLVRAIESLVLYDEASLQQISRHNSNIRLEVLQLEANGVCTAQRVPLVSLQHHCIAAEERVRWPGVFLAVGHASQILVDKLCTLVT